MDNQMLLDMDVDPENEPEVCGRDFDPLDQAIFLIEQTIDYLQRLSVPKPGSEKIWLADVASFASFLRNESECLEWDD